MCHRCLSYSLARSPIEAKKANELFKLNTFRVRADGGMLGRTSVIRVWRADVDPEEDVPEFAPEIIPIPIMNIMKLKTPGPPMNRSTVGFGVKSG